MSDYCGNSFGSFSNRIARHLVNFVKKNQTGHGLWRRAFCKNCGKWHVWPR